MANDSDEPNEQPAEAPAPAPQTVEEMITALEAQAQKLAEEKRELHDRLLRTAADFENWKKRAKKESDEAAQRGREALLKELLTVLDNLERALKHAAPDDPLAKGVQMVEKQFLGALEKFGITRFSAAGQPFDPSMHDAIQQVETAEVAPGTVAQEFAKGYLSNGKLLRPAMVAVAKAPPQPSAPPDGAGG
jgi:molecular chaperone GrpE